MLNSAHQHIVGRKTHTTPQFSLKKKIIVVLLLVVYDLASKASLREVFNDFFACEKKILEGRDHRVPKDQGFRSVLDSVID